MNFKHEICFRTMLISSLKLDVVTRESVGTDLLWKPPSCGQRGTPLECCAFTTLSFLKEYLAHRKHVNLDAVRQTYSTKRSQKCNIGHIKETDCESAPSLIYNDL